MMMMNATEERCVQSVFICIYKIICAYSLTDRDFCKFSARIIPSIEIIGNSEGANQYLVMIYVFFQR